ncbi:MAG: hypothetical protein JEY99_16580 [Spirochaetales bacterium]|nr:hypothetical protein [Spirochaetales bacterium]
MITSERKEQWINHLDAWKSSGLSANKYCIENGINKNSFRYWIDKDKGKSKKNKSFVKLNIQEPLSINERESISLKYGSYEITIPSDFKKKE